MSHASRRYALMAGKAWGRAIAGPVLAFAGLVLLALQLVFPNSHRVLQWGGWSLIGIAGVMGFAAQYELWSQEHEARCKAEDELNAEADIRGIVWAKPLPGNPNADQSKPASNLRLDCQCANHGRKSCEISFIRLVIANPAKPDFKPDTCPLQSPETVNPGKSFRYAGTFYISGLTPDELAASTITVVLVDSLGTEYRSPETRKVI